MPTPSLLAAIDREMASLRAMCASPDAMEAQRMMFATHSSALADRFQPLVAAALHDEVRRARQEGGWWQQAKALVGAGLVRGNSPGRVAWALKAGARLDPDDHEIRTHSQELAQLVWSNWVGTLLHEARDKGGTLTLAGLAPDEAQIMEGVGWFVLEEDVVLEQLRQYRDLLVQAMGHTLLAPTVHLSRQPQGGWAVRIDEG